MKDLSSLQLALNAEASLSSASTSTFTSPSTTCSELTSISTSTSGTTASGRSEVPLTEGDGKCNVLPAEHHIQRLSRVASSRSPSPIWNLLSKETESQPGMLSMLVGKPHPSTFPFQHITLGVRSPDGETTELSLQQGELASALQYGPTAGSPELVQWTSVLMQTVHSRRQNEGWRVSLGAGSQDLLYKAFNALLNPGDTIIVEGPTYPTIMPILDAIGCRYAVVNADEDGTCVNDLERILEEWDESAHGRFPRVFYTVPVGSNPAGVTTTHARRVEVLRLARRYDLMILEDDPYYFLYYGDTPRPPSYFTLERQLSGDLGRVLRFDSFSKVLSSGFRLGWVTGPDAILTAIERHSAVSVVQPSSLSQAIALKLLKSWGISGFLQHTSQTAAFYKKKRDALHSYLEEHLGRKGLAEWKRPDASMFFWVKLNLLPLNVEDPGDRGCSTAFIRDKLMANGVLFLPGATAFPDGRTTACVRLSFSLLEEAEMEEAVKRVARVLCEEHELSSKTDGPAPLGTVAPVASKQKRSKARRARGRKSSQAKTP